MPLKTVTTASHPELLSLSQGTLILSKECTLLLRGHILLSCIPGSLGTSASEKTLAHKNHPAPTVSCGRACNTNLSLEVTFCSVTASYQRPLHWAMPAPHSILPDLPEGKDMPSRLSSWTSLLSSESPRSCWIRNPAVGHPSPHFLPTVTPGSQNFGVQQCAPEGRKEGSGDSCPAPGFRWVLWPSVLPS